jgi:Protein of unknown function DUF262
MASRTAPGTARTAAIERRWEEAQDSLVLQAADLSLGTLRQMIDSKQIDIAPRYQRRERWDTARQSSLIESFLLNVPVPPIYLSEERIGRFSVIDGKQRLTAIHRFLSGHLRLQDLATFVELEGLSLKDLPSGVTGNLEVRPLRAVTLLRQSNPDLKYEVFTRLNRNGQPLDPQEIRNVLFRGPLNDLVFTLSTSPFLHQQMKITNESSERYKKMEDVEMVLRFLTLRDEWQSFSGDYRRSMDRYMSRHQTPSKQALDDLADHFNTSLRRCDRLWGSHAFKRPDGPGWRDQFLAGLYDAEMLACDALTAAEANSLAKKQKAVLAATRKLFSETDFEAAVRQATNTPQRVRLRVRRMTQMLKQLS